MYELKVVRERRQGYAPTGASLASPDAVHRAFRAHFAPLDREQFVIALLDTRRRVIGFHVVSVGHLNMTLVHPREVFKVAILGNAASLVVMHNHPSGDALPSAEDREITARLIAAGQLMGIEVVDHVVFGDDGYYSIRSEAGTSTGE